MAGAPDSRSTLPAEAVFVVDRDLDAAAAHELRPRLLRHLAEHGPDISLDLGQVHFIDSTGMGLLVMLLREARQRGGSVRLRNPQREVRRLLQITGLEVLFEIGTLP